MRIFESLFLAGMFAIPFSGYGAEKFQEQKLPETPTLQKVLKKFSADELFFLESLLPQDFFLRIAEGKFERQLYPELADRKAWESVRNDPQKKQLAQKIIADADHILKQPIPELRFSVYRQFAKNGNRAQFEDAYFKRRNNFGILTLALCLTGNKERYLEPVMDYICAILEEETWCIPAHRRWRGTVPLEIYQADLFASATGTQLALAVNILGNELEKELPGLVGKIRTQTLLRTVYNPLNPETASLNHWFFPDGKPGNWTPWCSFSNMVTAVCLEPNPSKLAEILRIYTANTSRFVHYAEENGFSEEGPGYFDKSNGMFFRSTLLFNTLIPGAAEKLWNTPKVRAMTEFIAALRVGSRAVCYSDNQPEFNVDQGLMLRAASALHSAELRNLAFLKPLEIAGGTGEKLSYGLTLLFADASGNTSAETAPEPVSYFKDNLAILRNRVFAVTLKAGNNKEYHNHNDLAHFAVFKNGEPVVVDIGRGRYTRKNFSPQRYEIYYTRGSGHNAPVFGTWEQQSAEEYSASLPPPQKTEDGWRMLCDASNAYPPEAGSRKFIRTIDCSETRVLVEDRVERTVSGPVFLNLFAAGKIEHEGNLLRIGHALLQLEGLRVERIEPLSDDTMLKLWKMPLSRIVLSAKANSWRMIFK